MNLKLEFIALGIGCIFCGVWLINFYLELKKKKQAAIMSIKLVSGGIGLILIGIALILREF